MSKSDNSERGELTSSQKKFVDASIDIQEQEAKQADAIGYMARALTAATIPHSDPKAESFTRENGNLKLKVVDMSGNGLPYGVYPRLILAWLTTEAVRTKKREIILGDSLSDFMKQLGIVPTGGRWGSITVLKNQIGRLFGAGFSVTYADTDTIRGRQHLVADDYQLWWNPKNLKQGSLFDSKVKLSDKFYEEIVERPVPIDMRALKALRRSPMALDIYMWLTYRMSYLPKNTSVSWAQLQLQLGAGYSFDSNGRKNFQRSFKKHLASVKAVYPAANYELLKGRLLLKPSFTHIKMVK